jgi:hypothetical protein
VIAAPVQLTLLVGTVAADPAPASLTRALREVVVTTTDDEMSGFQLTFSAEPGASAPDRALDTTLLLKPFARVVVVATLNGAPQVLCDGLVTKLDNLPAQGGHGAQLVVSGLDVSVAMTLHEESAEYPAEDAQMIVERLILEYAEYGLTPAVMPTVLSIPPLPLEQVPIQNGTDLGYIQQLASMFGYVFYVTPGPVPLTSTAYWGPPVRTGLPQPALSVDVGPGTNVESLSFEYDAMKPATYHGDVLDLTTNFTQPVQGLASLHQPPLAERPALLANRPYTRSKLLRHAGLNVAQAEVLAESLVSRSTDEVVTARGELDTFRYGSVLRARGLVGVRGAGLAYDGMYYLKRVSHRIARGTWRQEFALVREGLGTTVPEVLP